MGYAEAEGIRSAANPMTAITAHTAANQSPYRVYSVCSEM
jgi:hypothetical protein